MKCFAAVVAFKIGSLYVAQAGFILNLLLPLSAGIRGV
jgi:hypothetical protein